MRRGVQPMSSPSAISRSRGSDSIEIVAIFSGVFSGKHMAHPKVDHIQAAAIAVESDPPLRLMADGELIGWTPLRLKVLPAELDVLA